MRISDWSSDVCSSDLVVEYTYAACLYDHVRIGGASDHLAGGVYGCGINLHICPLGRINVAVRLPVIGVGLKEADLMTKGRQRAQHAAVICGCAVPIGGKQA